MNPSILRMPRSAGAALVLALLFTTSGASGEPADAAGQPILPRNIEYLLRSALARESGELGTAGVWAEALSAADTVSGYAASRYAQILESQGDDMGALTWGNRALLSDGLSQDGAMLVGRMRLRAGGPSMAVKALTPPLRVLGGGPELYALRALAHELARNYEASLADLKRTGELLPDFGWIATGVLGMALEDDHLPEAMDALRLALDINPDEPRALGLGIELARRLGDPGLEAKLLRQRAEAEDALPEQMAAYVAFLVREGDRRGAEAYLGRIRERGFDPAEARVEAARSLLRDGEFKAAIAAVKPVRNPRAALPIRARALVGIGNEKQSLRCYHSLGSLRALTQEESLMVAWLEIRVGDRSEGVRVLRGIREGLLSSPRRLLAGALCYVALKHPEEAVSFIREGLSRGVESPMIYAELGQTAVSIGDTLVAEWAFQKLVSLGKENSECLYFLAASDLNRGVTDRAIQRLEKAVELNPSNGRALSLLGSIRYNLGQLELARDLLIRAVRCPDAGPEAELWLGRACRALRLDSEAREAESRGRGKRLRPGSSGLTLNSKP